MARLLYSSLPKKPGVYLFKDQKQKILYVGKAQNLRSRVKSYFTITDSRLPKTQKLVEKINKIDHLLTKSGFEALLLEAELIKKYQPKYNSLLKDDKSFLYVKITQKDDFPKVSTARRERSPDNIYFGPFPSARIVRETLKFLRRFFPFCNCNFKLCRKKNYCFWVEIGLDSGPCVGLIKKRTYRAMIKNLTLLLSGKSGKVLAKLEKEMKKKAKEEKFEEAQFLKRQIEGVRYVTRRRLSPTDYLETPELLKTNRLQELKDLKKILKLKKTPIRIECFDISNIQGRQATGSMVVSTRGEADKSQYRRLRIRLPEKPNDVAMMKEVIKRRLKHPEWPLADLIVVDGGKGQVSGAVSTLKEMGLEIPVIGLAKRLEEIIIPGKPRGKEKRAFNSLNLKNDSSALRGLQNLRDEAHRFAVAYHRHLRLKGLFKVK